MVEAGKGTYQGKSQNDLIEEKIDEVVLRALGLDDVFDLDYGTYQTLLKERMMADRMGQKMDTSEVEAVTNEYKRIKGKVGRFRLKREKISANAFKTRVTKSTAPIAQTTRMLPGTTFANPAQLLKPVPIDVATTEKGGPIVSSPPGALAKKPYTYNFKKIEDGLDDIIKSLKGSDNFEKEKEKKRKQEEGRKKKKDRESTLEKTIGAIAKIGKKILEPLKGPLDYIINWIKWTFLGKVVHNLLNWMSDPANTKKMESIGRFMKDWWPALVGAYLIFGNSLGRFVSKLIFTVGAFTARMTLAAIPKLLKVIRSPLGMGAMLFGAGAAIPMLMPETVDEQERKTDKAVAEKGKDKVRAELERKANNPNVFERLTGQDAEAKEQLYKMDTGQTKSYGFAKGGKVTTQSGTGQTKSYGFAKGGKVTTQSGTDIKGQDAEAKEQLYKMDTGQTKSYGFAKGGKVTTRSGTDIKGAGVDTQLIAARPGEVVINKPTVDALGAPFFLALNQKYGGANANKPKLAKNVQSAAFGGMVLPAFANGGQVSTGSLMNDPMGALGRIYNRYVPKGDEPKPLPEPKVRKDPEQSYPAGESPKSGGSSGSLMTDPIGAIMRIYNRYAPKGNKQEPPKGEQPKPLPPIDGKSSPSPKQEEDGIADKIIKSPTFRDSGIQYLRAMMGGLGGPITETQLSKESKDELTKALNRAKKRTSKELEIATRDYERAKKEKWSNLAEVKSVYDRLKRGEVRVEYEDYYEGGKISAAAEDAKSILGKFWAQASVDGGYRVVNEKYDFVDMPDPWAVIRGDSRGISKVDAGKPQRSITLRERLQALYQLNPFARDMEVDMVLGKKGGDPMRTAQNLGTMVLRSVPAVNDAFYLAEQLRGKPEPEMTKKERENKKALESKRPWWDKFGLFGGATAEMERKKKNKPIYGPGGSSTGSGRGQAQQKPPQKLNKAQQIYGAKTPVITKTKKPQRAWYDPRGWIGKQGGGSIPIKENTGIDIPGATADRQLIAVEPGESKYIIPKGAVENGAIPMIDNIVARLDSNSNPAKMGARNLKPIPGPPVAGRSGMMTLPPITGGGGASGSGGGSGGGKQIPSFSATSPYSGERQNNADIYGIK